MRCAASQKYKNTLLLKRLDIAHVLLVSPPARCPSGSLGVAELLSRMPRKLPLPTQTNKRIHPPARLVGYKQRPCATVCFYQQVQICTRW